MAMGINWEQNTEQMEVEGTKQDSVPASDFSHLLHLDSQISNVVENFTKSSHNDHLG